MGTLPFLGETEADVSGDSASLMAAWDRSDKWGESARGWYWVVGRGQNLRGGAERAEFRELRDVSAAGVW